MNDASLTRAQRKVALCLVILLGMAIRAASWWSQGMKGGSDSEFATMARLMVDGDWPTYFAQNRPHQPVYALLLAPQHMFGFELTTYVFVLHSLLACGTMYLVFRIAQFLFGPICGLLSALLVAVNLMIALWFPWMSGDVGFHFFLALFAFSAVKAWQSPNRRTLPAFATCAVLCLLSRPEGLFVAAVAGAVLVQRLLGRAISSSRFALLIVAAIVLCSTAIAAALYYNKPVRESVFSNIHVSYSLYISTRMSTNSPQEQAEAYSSFGPIVEAAQKRPDFVSPRYALSMEGLRFIREQPLTWGGMYVLRLTSIVFPSVYSPWWSAKNRLYSFTMSFVLVVGSLIGCFLAGAKRLEAIGLVLMGLTIALIISLFQREVDHRVPLSVDLLLACVAPFGWVGVFEALTKQRSHA